MRLAVHRTGRAFLKALETGTGCYYAVFSRSRTDPAVLREAEAHAQARQHQDVIAATMLHAPAENALRRFLEEACRADPERRYAFSSRVLLAIRDYPDIALMFLLRALRTLDANACVHVLAENPWQAALAASAGNDVRQPRFRPGITRGLGRAARSAARSVLARRTGGHVDAVIFTLGESVARSGSDAYFGEFARTLGERLDVLTVYAAPGTQLRLAATNSAVPLEAFLSPIDALRAWRATHHEGGTDGIDPIAAYLKANEHASGEVVMLGVMRAAFDRMLARLKPRVVIYPFENRSWERSLVDAARRHGARPIGYQHSSITPRHYAFRSTHAQRVDDLPDAIVTCGEVTADLIREQIPRARPIVHVGAALRARRLAVASPEQPGVLVPISSSRAEAWELLRTVHELASRSNVPVIVRTHPAIPIDDLFAQFAWPTHVTLSRGRTLEADLGGVTLVVYSSSTVALEGLLYGRLAIYVDIGDLPSGDPMPGAHPFVLRVHSADELAQTIAAVDAYTSETLAALRQQAREYAERYLIEPTAERIARMADLVSAC